MKKREISYTILEKTIGRTRIVANVSEGKLKHLEISTTDQIDHPLVILIPERLGNLDALVELICELKTHLK